MILFLTPCICNYIFAHHKNIQLTHLPKRNVHFLGGIKAIGLNFNMVQVHVLLALVAQITGHKAGQAYHKIVNAHIYEDQLELMRDVQLKREPLPLPKLHINPKIKTLEDLETWVTLDDFEVTDYQHHDVIKYPFSV
ncbi:thymidylate synthase [Moritella viscosa]|uniref:thymidylate synthase n=1 Tax=Moritella viscosa TaxID=80854 RepID=UPI0026765AD6|nr:thymidylate synthase [Moritella viscosa]